jgi:hypothetical protein
VVSHKATHTLRALLIYWFPHLSSNYPWLTHQSSLAVTNRHLVATQVKIGEKCPWIFLTNMSLTCREILRHGTASSNSPLKEVVLRIFMAIKIHRPRPALNPQTLGTMTSTITTRLPRATNSVRRTFNSPLYFYRHYKTIIYTSLLRNDLYPNMSESRKEKTEREHTDIG